MDWRGFSRFDIPLAVRTLMYDVDDVSAIEAAVIQGVNYSYYSLFSNTNASFV